MHISSLQLDTYEIDEGNPLKINVSEPKTRLFVGNIPKSKGKDEIEEELKKVTGKPISPTRTVGQILIAVPVLLSFLIKYKVISVHFKKVSFIVMRPKICAMAHCANKSLFKLPTAAL